MFEAVTFGKLFDDDVFDAAVAGKKNAGLCR